MGRPPTVREDDEAAEAEAGGIGGGRIGRGGDDSGKSVR